MGSVLRFVMSGLFVLGFAVGGATFFSDPSMIEKFDGTKGERSVKTVSSVEEAKTETASSQPPRTEDSTFPIFTTALFETAGFGTANRFTGEIADRGSLEQVREAIATRAQRGIDICLQELESITPDDPSRDFRKVRAEGSLIFLLMYLGRFDEAAAWTEKAIVHAGMPGVPKGLQSNLKALLGVIHLRRGETENCVDCMGPSSCILPIAPEAVHQITSGSTQAVINLEKYVKERPQDIGARWLVNIGYMTLGTYPRDVPKELLVPEDRFRAAPGTDRFENAATLVGLGGRGPNMAGGSIFDDFTGDGLPDVFTTSLDLDLGASLFVNKGDGTFEDRSASTGLKEQVYAVNCVQGDYDNDGDLDVIVTRGGWENPAPLSLLRNDGKGVFEDVTRQAGITGPIASHSAVWGDFDNDGDLDLFVCGEYAANSADGIFSSGSVLVSDRMNECRLYCNLGNGRFENVADQAGVLNRRYAKAAVAGDFNGDGKLDLFVSNCGQENRLYLNHGDMRFEDVAARLGVAEPINSFSCGALDYDNDGKLDLLVVDYAASMNEWATRYLGLTSDSKFHTRLFKNMGESGFEDVSLAVGLDQIVLSMGIAIGDINNDGFLDVYLATGRPDYSALMPNILYKNHAGKRFEDVTLSSGTGHLQKGHGSSFADWDGDGDLDLFIEVGGAVPGDKAHNLLFQNVGDHPGSFKVKLVGEKTNRSGIGARLKVDLETPGGGRRSIHRSIGAAANYGGSSLVETIGLGDAVKVSSISVTWPIDGSTQTFYDDIKSGAVVVIHEGESQPKITEEKRLPELPAIDKTTTRFLGAR